MLLNTDIFPHIGMTFFFTPVLRAFSFVCNVVNSASKRSTCAVGVGVNRGVTAVGLGLTVALPRWGWG